MRPAAERAGFHGRALAVLRAGDRPDVGALARHAVAAADAAAVLEYAPRAAALASGLEAHRAAAAHYRSALPYAAAGGPGAGVVAPAACGPYHAGDGRGPSFVPPRQPRPALNGRAHALTVCAPPLSVVSDTPVARIESVGDNQAASINGITLIEKFDENARSPAVGAVTGASRRCPGRMPLWVICAPVPCRRNRRGSCPVALPGGRSQLIRAGWRPRARAGLRRQAYILPGPGKLRMRRTSPRRGGRADGTRRLRPVRSALPATSSW